MSRNAKLNLLERIFPKLALASSAIILFAGVVNLIRYIPLYMTGVRTRGQVVSAEKGWRGRWYPVYQFADSNGNIHTVKSHYHTWPKPWVGKDVTAMHDSNNPEKSEIFYSFFSLFGFTIPTVILGGFFAALGIIALRENSRKGLGKEPTGIPR